MNHTLQKHPSKPSLLSDIPPFTSHQFSQCGDDQAWIEVIRQMDTIYAELVSQQVELEEKNAALENSRFFIQSILSSMSDILIVCDINSSILQVNSALEAVTGIPSEDLTGTPLLGLFVENQHVLVADFPDRIRSGAQIDIEVDLRDINHESIPMAIICNPLYDHKNRLAGFVLTGRPLGELRKAYSELHQAHESLKNTQRRLIQSEKMASLGRLVAGVAHELNNPISFLYANMHALQGYDKRLRVYLAAVHGRSDPAECEKLRSELNIDRIINDIESLATGSLEGAERVSEIVQNLRKFSTPQQQSKTRFDLVHVIKRATSWVLNAATISPKIKTDYPDHLLLINNEGHVHQILINLIQNAIDSLVESNISKPRLDIDIQKHQTGIHIRIHDNGPGIHADDLDRIFDPFFTTKPVGSGTGLGLYISYGLAVEHCQGELSAYNHENGGAVFTLVLPHDAS